MTQEWAVSGYHSMDTSPGLTALLGIIRFIGNTLLTSATDD